MRNSRFIFFLLINKFPSQDRRNGRVAKRNEECRKNETRKSSAGKRSVSRINGMTVEARMMIMTVIAGIGMLMSGVAIATTGVMMNMTAVVVAVVIPPPITVTAPVTTLFDQTQRRTMIDGGSQV